MIMPMYDVVGSWNCKWIRTLENRYLRLTHTHTQNHDFDF